MSDMMTNIRGRMARRAAYRRTLAELRSLPMDTRLDLDIAGVEDQDARNFVELTRAGVLANVPRHRARRSGSVGNQRAGRGCCRSPCPRPPCLGD